MRTLSLIAAAVFVVAGFGACDDDNGGTTPPKDSATDSPVQMDAGVDTVKPQPDTSPDLEMDASPDGNIPIEDGASNADADAAPSPDGAGDGPLPDTTPAPDTQAPDAACPPPANDDCTKPKVLTWSGTQIVEKGNTTCATDDLDFPAGGCAGSLSDGTGGYDVFFKISLPAGSFSVTLEPKDGTVKWDAALYVVTSCSTNACVAGSDNVNAGVTETIKLNPATTTDYLIGVDGYKSFEAGPFTLTVTGSAAPDAGVAADSTVSADSTVATDSAVSADSTVVTDSAVSADSAVATDSAAGTDAGTTD